MQNYIKNLLPVGFQDIMPPNASEEFSIVNRLINHSVKFGYEQIKPTMIEFEKNTASKLKKKQSPHYFLVMDPYSNEMVKIRSDMTVQIARIARMQLSNAPRPLRLSYTGQVLRATGSGLNSERQITQTGVEFIGSKDIKNSIIEIITIALSSFSDLGLKNISIDFNLAGFTESIMLDDKIPQHKYNEIYNLIDNKDISALSKTNYKSTKLIIDLINSAGSSDKSLAALDKMSLPEATQQNIGYLKEINNFIKENFSDISVTIDPIERRGFEYHSDISFSIFSKDNGEELGRGGHYDIGEAVTENAVGFTLNVNEIARIYNSKQTTKRILVDEEISLDILTNLHDEGFVTVKYFSSDFTDIEAQKIAKGLKCKFIFSNGNIVNT